MTYILTRRFNYLDMFTFGASIAMALDGNITKAIAFYFISSIAIVWLETFIPEDKTHE